LAEIVYDEFMHVWRVSFNNASAITAPILCIGVRQDRDRRHRTLASSSQPTHAAPRRTARWWSRQRQALAKKPHQRKLKRVEKTNTCDCEEAPLCGLTWQWWWLSVNDWLKLPSFPRSITDDFNIVAFWATFAPQCIYVCILYSLFCLWCLSIGFNIGRYWL